MDKQWSTWAADSVKNGVFFGGKGFFCTGIPLNGGEYCSDNEKL